jgi:hypothetical protein
MISIIKSFGTDPDRSMAFILKCLAPFWIHRLPSTKKFPLHHESLWFNRFTFDPDRNTRGRSFTKSTEDKLIKLGFTYVRDLLSTQVIDDKL